MQHFEHYVLAKPYFESIQKLVYSDLENKPERVFVDFSDGHRNLRTISGFQCLNP